MTDLSSAHHQKPTPEARPADSGTDRGTDHGTDRLAFGLLFVVPVLLASNMLAARAAAGSVPPVSLALGRWMVAALVLLPFVAPAVWRQRAALKREWLDLLILGAMGMGVCGAFVYIGAETTTATNIGLLYSFSPVAIILVSAMRFGDHLSATQYAGVAAAVAGVVVIIARGDAAVLFGLEFVVGDLWIVAAAIGWAIYSLMLKHRPSAFSTLVRFFAIAVGGVIVLAPFAVWEAMAGNPTPATWDTLGWYLFLGIVPGVGAYWIYGFLVDRLGPGKTGLTLYLIPVYNGVLAWAILGETIKWYHLAGAALVLPGLYFATRQRARS